MCLSVAPKPKATAAILWVDSAMLNGRPRKINDGSCSNPAPPPAMADKVFDKSEIKNKRACSIRGFI